MEKTIIEEICGTAEFIDSDETEAGNVTVIPADGWELIGDTGYVSDYGWNDVPWHLIEGCEDLSDETTVDMDDPVYSHRLPDDYMVLTVRHEDDDYGNRGTSESCTWFVHYIFKRQPTEEEP